MAHATHDIQLTFDLKDLSEEEMGFLQSGLSRLIQAPNQKAPTSLIGLRDLIATSLSDARMDNV